MYQLSWMRPKQLLPFSSFQGRFYNKPVRDAWVPYIPVFSNPIRYLEIGVSDGGNLFWVANVYGQHPETKLHGIDPWMDYEEYPEYKELQEKGWNTFQTNLAKSGQSHKIVIHRGFSGDIVPTFEDESFDMIFVDGNHETEFVYKDGVMSFQKCKKGGYIIFDDYCEGWSQTMKGIDQFLEEYGSSLKIIQKGYWGQVIVQKL